MRRLAALGSIAALALAAAPCQAQDEPYLSARQVIDYLHSQDAGEQKIGQATLIITWQAFVTTQAALAAHKDARLYCPPADLPITHQQLADGVETVVGQESQLADMPVSMALLVYLDTQYPCPADAGKAAPAGR